MRCKHCLADTYVLLQLYEVIIVVVEISSLALQHQIHTMRPISVKSNSVIKVSIILWWVYLSQKMKSWWEVGNKVVMHRSVRFLHRCEVVSQSHSSRVREYKNLWTKKLSTLLLYRAKVYWNNCPTLSQTHVFPHLREQDFLLHFCLQNLPSKFSCLNVG